MRLIHYSKNPITKLKHKPYLQSELSWQAKPNGLWISVEGEKLGHTWKEWCEQEDFCIESLAHSYELILKENSNILHIKTPLELLEFTKKYPFLREQWNDPIGREICDAYELDWTKVKEDYQGIIIAPYQWDCRCACETVWYYGWDIPSGCIWDINCIKEFNLCSS